MTRAQAVTECLNLEKVKHVFCVPGESYLALINRLEGFKNTKGTFKSGGSFFIATPVLLVDVKRKKCISVGRFSIEVSLLT